MTASNDLDFDRRLADLLADGPTSAPERTIVFALDHAAAHPRRRDLLHAVRRDPMRSPAFGGSMRVLPLVAALGLLAILALGVAFVGGAFNQTPVTVPPPIASPSPSSPTATPSAPPSPPPIVAHIHVDLIEHVGQDASIDITDRSGDIVSAAPDEPGEGASVEEGKIQVTADTVDPKTLILHWTGLPCDATHTLDIAPDHTLTITRPACGGDTLPVDRVLRLSFRVPLDPATVTGTVVTTAS